MIEELKPYIVEIIQEIMPEGKEMVVSGKREYLCRCPFHQDSNPSFYINLDEGVYHCFGCGVKGDLIHLYAQMNDLDDKEALIELKKRFLPESTSYRGKEQKLDNLLQKALFIWNNSKKSPDLVKRYLKARGIGATPSLRYLRLYKDNIMLAKVVSPDNKLKSLHMTILEDKEGKIKAKEKKMMKELPIKGYAVHFGEPVDSLAIAEGIETALSIKEALPSLPIWACLSAVNMPELLLLEDNTIKNVYIFFDKDKSKVGLKSAEELARKLTKDKDIDVYFVEPPMDIPKDENSKGVDFNDVLIQKGREAIILAFKKAKKFESGAKGLKSPVDVGVSLVVENSELFYTKDGETYAKIKKDNFTEIRKIRSLYMKKYISSIFYKRKGNFILPNNIQNVIDILDAMATNDGKEEPIFKRVAFHKNRLYLDLADEKWRVVEISEDGWKVLDKSPVNFVRFKNTLPLPEPKRSVSSGSSNPIERDEIRELKKLFNLEKEEDFYVIIDFLLNVLSPFENYIGLALIGEQGTAKTTAARIIKHIVDPDRKTKLSTPKNEEDLIIASKTSKLLFFDNLSRCTQRFSDSLCRLLDGSGLAKRKLFTDEDESVLYASSPVILTSITNPFTYPDLLDRLVVLNLKPIDQKDRRTEEEIFKKLNELHPYILSSLFDLVSSGLRNIAKVNLQSKPRRADFAVWLTACEYDEYLKAEEKLLPAYLSNIENIVTISLDNDPLASTLIEWFESKEKWEGTVTELKNQILSVTDKERKVEIPKASNKFSERLIRLSSFLRKVGINIERKRTNRGSIITISTIVKTKK